VNAHDVAERTGLEPLLTLDELAALAGESRRTIERRIREGRIPVKRLGPRSVRVTAAAARRYLAAEPGPLDGDNVRPLRSE
jgi:excisionase family DNA binding protein